MDAAERLYAFTVRETDTLEAALARIEANGLRSVIVLDGRGRVMGTLSDGDARKALLNRRLISTQVRQLMNLNFVWLPPAEVHRAKELFERHRIFMIPVMEDDQKLVDVLKAY
jgi:CBS domain-containing protein